MIKLLIFSIAFVFISPHINAQERNRASSIKFYIDKSVTNSNETYFLEIQELWKNYLESFQYFVPQSRCWDTSQQALPDFSYAQLFMYLRSANNGNQNILCNILAIIPVENNYYMIKSMFTEHADSAKQINLEYITSVYAKKKGDAFVLVNSTQYHKEIWNNRQVGAVNYIIHPTHQFDLDKAIKMNQFNSEIAALFEIEPIQFDYVVTNNTIQLSKLIGYDFFSYSYMPIQSGGLADIYNGIIYAGNNSAYYPHEVVHLYVHARFQGQYHPWTNEGVAALFGGSTGYNIEWHWQKLKSFLEENPTYELNSISALEINIPNGEYTTDFRYAIGGYLCKQIYEQEGMQGLFDVLQAGNTEDDYFDMLHSKLGITRATFGEYIILEMARLKKIDDSKLERFKY